ncbi:hypothetical protein MMC16_001656 [Acarospora aff. strigata]|nr:hypothetical protein [Acarospora aff. strigata]
MISTTTLLLLVTSILTTGTFTSGIHIPTIQDRQDPAAVTDDTIKAPSEEPPFPPALAQLESGATTDTTYNIPRGMIVGTPITTAASIAVKPTTMVLSGWQTDPPSIVGAPVPAEETTLSTLAISTAVNVTAARSEEMSPSNTTSSAGPSPTVTTQFLPPVIISTTSSDSSTNPTSSASATATGGAQTLSCITRTETLALIMASVLAAMIFSR